jgi:hypothetical protein
MEIAKMTEREIMRESALQNARIYRWQGWDWREYQTVIIRQNYAIGDLEAQLDKYRNEQVKQEVMVYGARHQTL